jgi:WD40 repeat protein
MGANTFGSNLHLHIVPYQVQFTPDGRFVFAGGRKSGEILGWDLRNTASPIFVLKRDCRSNQRVYFDIDRDSKCLVSGSVDGTVFIVRPNL